MSRVAIDSRPIEQRYIDDTEHQESTRSTHLPVIKTPTLLWSRGLRDSWGAKVLSYRWLRSTTVKVTFFGTYVRTCDKIVTMKIPPGQYEINREILAFLRLTTCPKIGPHISMQNLCKKNPGKRNLGRDLFRSINVIIGYIFACYEHYLHRCTFTLPINTYTFTAWR